VVVVVYCGQTTGWIKMPLGTEVYLDPGDIVLDGGDKNRFAFSRFSYSEITRDKYFRRFRMKFAVTL